MVRRWSRSNGVSITGSLIIPFPTGRVILISFKVIFSPRLNLFLGVKVVSLFCFGSSLSLNSTFDNMLIFTNRSRSLFISSVRFAAF